MFALLCIFPCVAGCALLCIRNDALRNRVFIAIAAVHLTGSFAAIAGYIPNGVWLGVDALSKIFLGITSILFFAVSWYTVEYTRRQPVDAQEDAQEKFLFRNIPRAVFSGCLLFFLSAMTLAIVSRHLGLFWVAMEATTLATAPLIYYHRHHRSLEAMWKYLLICSVGIALALLGNLFLAVAGMGVTPAASLFIDDLVRNAAVLDVRWLMAAFLFLFVGYGTKMGLAPMHTWLPDAHSESPSPVSALLSGALLNCAFLGIARMQQIFVAGDHQQASNDILIVFGVLSVCFAAVFILGQADYKRMLAYSSVEHMGIIAFACGCGKTGAFFGLLHAINHSCAKAGLFMIAGNIVDTYKTKVASSVQGVVRVLPASGSAWLAGLFIITGFPPAGIFITEFNIFNSAFVSGHIYAGIVYMIGLVVIFAAMARICVPMALGGLPAGLVPAREKAVRYIVPIILFCIVCVLGVWLPEHARVVLEEAAGMLGGTS